MMQKPKSVSIRIFLAVVMATAILCASTIVVAIPIAVVMMTVMTGHSVRNVVQTTTIKNLYRRAI